MAEDGAAAAAPADQPLAARFARAYRGPHDPADALAWSADPDAPGPSGAPSPAAALRRERVALYRADATDADRRRVAAAEERWRVELAEIARARAAATEPARGNAVQAPAAPLRRPIRSVVIAGGAVLAAGALVTAGIAASGGVPARPPYPTVASTPIAFLGGERTAIADRRGLAGLFAPGRTDTLGLYLSRNPTALSAQLRTDSIAVDGRATGSRTFSLAGLDNGEPTGLMSVLLTCDRAAAYSWVLTDGRRPATRIGASGDDCSGAVVLATFVPKPGHIPTHLTVHVPAGVRTIIEVDLSHD